MALDCVMLTNHRPQRQLITPATTDQKLLAAIKHESVSTVVQLLATGVDINGRGENCWTPLTLACRLGRKSIVKVLLETEVEPDNNVCAKTRSCPATCDINKSNDNGDTPLICAAREGHIEVVEVLLQAGADPNLPNPYSSLTPLLVAIDNGHIETVASLLSHEADVQLTDNVKLTPLYMAIKVKDCDIRDILTQRLIQAGCDVNIGSQDHAPVFLAARLGFLSTVEMLCEAGCDVDVSNKYGVTPLYEAAMKGHNDVVKYLLSRGCELNKQDMYGVGPLHVASVFNNAAAVNILITAGASIKQRDQSGRCAVHAAMEQGFADVVEVFLRHGVDITQAPTSVRNETSLTRYDWDHQYTFDLSWFQHKLSSLNKLFEHGHRAVIRVLMRGCTQLPLYQCRAGINVFRSDLDLVELLLVSGLRGSANVFLMSQHPSQHLLDPHVAAWLDRFHRTPQSLQNLSRIKVRRCLGNKVLHLAPQLPLPKRLIEFLTLSPS
ncbi:ankyrin repeat and SOCS box protein 2-like isoform X1 [Haliotis cracherodii]|uniref:ankyrin repeat and SOCS box protein 2-like isoform X1 n=1 Tax=Haliotis cracherodii TaxID=6455 RepID=UPI0039EAF067